MDRQIVWPGAIPLEADILNTNRNTMVALGRLAMDILGSSTLASGLACTPTAVPSLAVNIGPGAIYSLQNVDNTPIRAWPRIPPTRRSSRASCSPRPIPS